MRFVYCAASICYVLDLWEAPSTVGFHDVDLRTFYLGVSNPNKLIVDVFLTRCRISMCQGLGPKKHDEISEIDRMRRKGTNGVSTHGVTAKVMTF